MHFIKKLLFMEIEFYFLFGVTPRGLWPTSGLEFQDKSSVPNIKTFGLDPIISVQVRETVTFSTKIQKSKERKGTRFRGFL